MSSISLILLLVALMGFMPLAIILYRKNRVKKILTSGQKAKAIVHNVMRIPRSAAEIVHYWFTVPGNTQQYTGSLTIQQGTYKTGDMLEIFYLPGNPRRNTVNGAWGSPVIIVFGIIIAVFLLFAVYQMYEMYKDGSM